VVISNRRETVIEIRAFSKSRINSSNPLSVNVKVYWAKLRENNVVPGSFQINKITKDKTKEIGKRHQSNSFLIGRSDCQYSISINAYSTANSLTL
jgi:hypothetical protein